MRKKQFTAEILTGHKDNALEVPFNPSEAWGLPAQPIWRGRRGHPVSGTLNGFRFEESFIVPRARKYFMIIDKDLSRAAGVSVGDTVRIQVIPKED
jgi:hypothetical protein